MADSLLIEPVEMPTDAQLVARARARDGAAYELIMRRYNRRLFRIAWSVLRNEAEAEDVVQESYVRAFTRLGDFIGPDGFSAWLAKIALNEARGRLRRDRRFQSLDGAAPEYGDEEPEEATMPIASPEPGPEQLAAAGELRRVLEQTIQALPESFRTVFVLRAVEQMSVAETAAVLAIPQATVKTRLHRAKALLQRDLRAVAESSMPHLLTFAGVRCDRIVAAVLMQLRRDGGL